MTQPRARTRLRQGRKGASAVLSTTLDGFFQVDMQGRILDVNEACCRMLGYTREELLKMSISDIEADETASEIAASIERIRHAGSAHLERRQRCKDGHLIDVEMSINAFSGDAGELSVLLRDVTERRQLEALLSGQIEALAMIARGASLAQSLDKRAARRGGRAFAPRRGAEPARAKLRAALQGEDHG